MNILQMIGALEKEDIEGAKQLLAKIELLVDDELKRRGLSHD